MGARRLIFNLKIESVLMIQYFGTYKSKGDKEASSEKKLKSWITCVLKS